MGNEGDSWGNQWGGVSGGGKPREARPFVGGHVGALLRWCARTGNQYSGSGGPRYVHVDERASAGTIDHRIAINGVGAKGFRHHGRLWATAQGIRHRDCSHAEYALHARGSEGGPRGGLGCYRSMLEATRQRGAAYLRYVHCKVGGHANARPRRGPMLAVFLE